MKKLTCEEMLEIIEGASSADLEDQKNDGSFNEHLEKCNSCMEAYKKNLALNNLLDEYKIPEPKLNLHAAIMTRIAQTEMKKKSGTVSEFIEQLQSLLKYKFRIPAFAVAVLTLLIIISGIFNITLFLKTNTYEKILADSKSYPGNQQATHQIIKSANEKVQVTPQIQDGSIQQVANQQTAIFNHGQIQPALVIIMGVPSDFFYQYPSVKAAFTPAVEEIRKNKENSK